MRKDNYHILIKNLTTNQEEGFMLASGDMPYQVQGIDNVAQRVADGEILYSDFTNSRVFAQSAWSEGISKYWDPERIYSTIYPSKKYKDKKNIEILEGEFTLGGSIKSKFVNVNGGECPMIRGETAGVVYVGSGMLLYRSTDFGNTWAVWKDFTAIPQLSDVNEITDIKFIDSNPFLFVHAAPMGSVPIGAIQCIFVCFYNRSTKKSGIARYDFNWTTRSAHGTTFIDGWSGSVNAAYSSPRASFTIDTNALATAPIAVYKVNNTYGIVLPASWQSYGLYPGQRIKLTRNATSVVYNLIISFVGGPFGYANGIGVAGIPNYDAVDTANNHYTLTEIGKNNSNICLPLTTGGIELWLYIGSGLGHNFYYNNILFTVTGLGNGRDTFGDLPPFFPGESSGAQDFVMIQRVDGGNAWAGITGNGVITVTSEKWFYKNGTYLNNVTKLVSVSGSREHLWGYNHIDPEPKLYDVGFGEIATNGSNSLIYGQGTYGVLAGWQNHTITFTDGSCPISGIGGGSYTSDMWIGTQFGPGNEGTEGNLIYLALNNAQTKPTFSIKGTAGDKGITCMTHFGGILYMGTKDNGNIWEWNPGNGDYPATFTNIAKLPVDKTTGSTIIDSMTNHAGKIVCSYQAGSGIYTLNPNSRQNQNPLIQTDVLCAVDELTNNRIYNICNTGGGLLFSNGLDIYLYDPDSIASSGYLESSIYGGYISNVDKLWIYAYVRMTKWLVDEGQRVALQVSHDEGLTWTFCPTKKGIPYSPTNDWIDDKYSIGFSGDHDKQKLLFFFPYQTLSGTIIYRCWIKKGTTIKPTVNHIGLHYNLNYRQELLFNYMIDLNKSHELLGGRTIEANKQSEKLAFLKDIWQNQYICKVTDVTGIEYTCMPYSDERTPGQGLIISTANANSKNQDIDNLTYKVAFSLKTIANYDKTL